MCARITNFARLFFGLLKVLRPCLYGLGYPSQPNGEQLHQKWPLRMRIVPPFGVRNTVKNFTKRSMEIYLTWSLRLPAHSKYEENSLYTVVKFQEEHHRFTEVMSHFARAKRFTLLLFWTFLHSAPILLGCIEPWVIGEKREVKTFETKKMSDKREILKGIW